MGRKIKCAIVDDDPEEHRTIMEFLKDCPIAEITHSFFKPSEVLENLYNIDVDVIFLDVIFLNDKLQGLDIADILLKENIIIIFISGNRDSVVEACKYAGALAVIPKPNTKERLYDALHTAWKIRNAAGLHEKEHILVYIAEKKEQISLYLPDVFFVKTATMGDPRNKEVIFKDGKRITLMNYSFKELLKESAKLGRINIAELISYDIVKSIDHDTINVKPDVTQEIPRILSLSKTYRKRFKSNFS